MGLFDWLFGRRQKPAAESPASPPPASPARPRSMGAGQRPSAPPQTEEPGDLPFADPYDTEYLPVTRSEIIDAAKSGSLLGTAFVFGRQSVIPPSADPRTNLIDRAMVTNGLLTPEELTEIHVVGEEYEKAKPTEVGIAAAAGLAGEAAV